MSIPKTAVALPQVSESAHFRITFEALEAIEETMMAPEDFGPEGAGMAAFFGWLDQLDYKRIKQLVGLAIVDAEPAAVFENLTISQIAERLADAMSLTLYGRDVAAQVEHREREYLEHMQKLAAKKKAITDE